MKKYVVIGASAAGISGAKTLRELDKEAEIIVVSKDTHVHSRCMLHQFIEGRRDIESLNFTNPGNFFEAYNITWMKGIEVTGIDPKEHVLQLSSGETLNYDKVLIASGASSFIPPVENLRQAKNVVGLRNLEDAIMIKELAPHIKNVAVLGAGLVGLDAVSGLLHSGVKISVIEMSDRILPLQLDHYAASKYEERFRKYGVDFKLGVRAEKIKIDDANNPQAVILSTGEEVPCQLIIVATGIRANIQFLQGSGIETDHFGLIINSKCETNTRDVYGAGDVTGRNPIWPSAVKGGIVAAHNMIGKEIHLTDYFSSKNTMYFVDYASVSLGTPLKPDDTFEEYIEKDQHNYKKMICKDGVVYGAIIQGDLAYVGVVTQMIKFKLNIKHINKPIFKIDYGDFFNVKQNQEFTY